ncbi:hypothetical protein BgiMline_009408, partial [Biomphalaria glabrata]
FNVNNYPDPKPIPETCRNFSGYQLYRNKNVQLCLKFHMFGAPVSFETAENYCK